MKIVLLDRGYIHKPFEKFDFSGLEKTGDFIYYDITLTEQILERISDADIIITTKTFLDANTIAKLKNAKLSCKVGTGLNYIDLPQAKKMDIAVTNFPGYGKYIVAQWTITLLLALATNMLLYDKSVKNNQWLESQFQYPIYDLRDKILGIIGYGHIGKRVAQLAHALGMRVLVSTRFPDWNTNIEFTNANTIYNEADFLSLHGTLRPETTAMINATVFNKMKKSSYLINTSRAALVCKASLYKTLSMKRIAGAAFDGFWSEPPENNDPLLNLENFIITPHMAIGSHNTRQDLINSVAERILKFSRGEPIPVVS